MTSQTSGYITMGNRSGLNQRKFSQDIPAPAKHFLMISFKRFVLSSGVELHRRYRSGTSKKIWAYVWRNSDASHMYNIEFFKFTVKATNDHYKRNKLFDVSQDLTYNYFQWGDKLDIYRRFKFFFSIFSQTENPQRSSKFMWNCSVENYSSFHHHLECNLWPECDDARDEHQHCAFSSEDCQGLVAVCGRCYKLSFSWLKFYTAEKYCKSHGGVISFPSCAYEPHRTMMKNKLRLWVDVHYCSTIGIIHLLLPLMYKYSLVSSDRTVFFHQFLFILRNHKASSLGLAMYQMMRLKLDGGMVCAPMCEINLNMTTISPQNRILYTIAEKPPEEAFYYFTQCQVGEVLHKRVVCGFARNMQCQQQFTFNCQFFSTRKMYIPLVNFTKDAPLLCEFVCSNNAFIALSYSLVCDFKAHCPDSSDETFCQHPVCDVSSFTCSNGQCVDYAKVCDGFSQCRDKSDKTNCGLREYHKGYLVPSPVLIDFDGIKYFKVIPINVNDSCPDSHYRCPGELNDCLPIYTRCNGMYDCVGHEDEQWCEHKSCSGLFECMDSPICVHSDHVCDGYPHCPDHDDDELWCDITCPVSSCLCQANSFLCIKPFNPALFPHLRSLDASGAGITLSELNNNVYLIRLVLAQCSLKVLPQMTLLNLKSLDLSHNRLSHVNISSISGLKNLQTLSMSNNPITLAYTDHSSTVQTTALELVDLSYTKVKVFDSKVWAMFVRLQKLNLTSTDIHTIGPAGFKHTPLLAELYLEDSPVEIFSADVFKGLIHLALIQTKNPKLCCAVILPSNFAGYCIAPEDEVSSCEDLLQSWTYRGFLWLMACLAITGNIFCFCARMVGKQVTSSRGFTVFVVNLTMVDFLMGGYMTVIGVADVKYRGEYLFQEHSWKKSTTCKIAGFLSLLSSEASALLICLITIDRFIVLCFPFSTWRFGQTSATLVCLLIWMVGWLLAFLPLLPMTRHWEFYSQTGICIPLPVRTKEFKGQMYSFSVMIAFNFVLFVLIGVGQALIYWSIQKNTFKTNSTKVSKDMSIAQRLIGIALTDFMCWFPIGLCGILALSGIKIPGGVNVALAIFILPLNSAINPFMYTLNVWAEKQRKSKESELLNWMENHVDLIDKY